MDTSSWAILWAKDSTRCSRFTEKPERDFAKIFVDSGEFYWNTSLFLFNVKHLYANFGHLLPSVLRGYDEKYPVFSVETENAYMKENFPSYPNISIDYAVLEKSNDVYVMKCDFGWADLARGTASTRQ